MVETLVQYVLIILLVTGLGYVVYLLNDNNVNLKEDYFGLAYVILGSLTNNENTSENIKKIIRIVSDAVKYVETNYNNSENVFKEEEAINVVKEGVSLLNLKSSIDSESLKYLIRLAAALLPPTNKVIE